MGFLGEDIFLESVRAAIVLVIFIYLWLVGIQRFGSRQQGWNLIVYGFGLLLFGSLMDITDEIAGLEVYLVIGDTPIQAVLEKVVGFLGGFSLLAWGLLQWIPRVRAMAEEVERQTIDLKEAIARSEDASNLKSQFLANMSHEIRTPMNGVIGATGLILASEISAEVKRYASTSLSSAESLLTLINDILDFSKIEAGKLDLEEMDYDVQTLMQDILDIFYLKCEKKHIDLLFHLDPDMPKFIVGDPGRLRQIVTNLLSNAMKFTVTGHVFLHIYASKKDTETPLFYIDVEDTGLGIAEEDQETIFRKFDQADASVNRRFGGSGLGLSICRSLALLMDGKLSLTSELQVGSKFSIELPLRAASKQPYQKPPFDVELVKDSRVLILDRNQLAADLVARQLKPYGVKTLVVESEKDAIVELVAAARVDRPFDVVIAAHYEPSLAEETLSKRIRAQKSIAGAAVVLALGCQMTETAARLKKAQICGCLQKPIFPGDAAAVVAGLMEAKRKKIDDPYITVSLMSSNNGAEPEVTTMFEKTYILLVEDNPVNQMIATNVLQKCGCTIAPAGDGIEAIEMFNNQKFDLILMDCNMPVMGGMEATKKIRALEDRRHLTRTPIIALTANAMDGDRQECIAAGMDDYVSKPVGRKALENTIAKWMSVKAKIVPLHGKDIGSTTIN